MRVVVAYTQFPYERSLEYLWRSWIAKVDKREEKTLDNIIEGVEVAGFLKNLFGDNKIVDILAEISEEEGYSNEFDFNKQIEEINRPEVKFRYYRGRVGEVEYESESAKRAYFIRELPHYIITPYRVLVNDGRGVTYDEWLSRRVMYLIVLDKPHLIAIPDVILLDDLFYNVGISGIFLTSDRYEMLEKQIRNVIEKGNKIVAACKPWCIKPDELKSLDGIVYVDSKLNVHILDRVRFSEFYAKNYSTYKS